MQGLKFQQLMRLESPSLLASATKSAYVSYLCSFNARWDHIVDSHSSLFETWAGELQSKHSTMPNVTEVLKMVNQFAHTPIAGSTEELKAVQLQALISSITEPGIIAATSQPQRALVVLGVALRQLCFAYNLLPPVELPCRTLVESTRCPLPTTMNGVRFLSMVLGHDAIQPLAEHDVLGLPRLVVRADCVALRGLGQWNSFSTELGVVWEKPSRDWAKVLRLISNAGRHEPPRLVVLLGGHECPFGFVRLLAAHDPVAAARLDLPSDIDCCASAIKIPAGVWSECPLEVASFANTSVIYGLHPDDSVLVINALQVLPCVLEFLVMRGRVKKIHMALGALPPESVRFSRLTPLTSFLTNFAMSSTPATIEAESPDTHRRCLDAEGITANDAVFQQLGAMVFSRSAARLDCANYTTTTLADGKYSQPRLGIAGSLGQVCQLADLLFLPRVVHDCPKHKCAVLVDIRMDAPAANWVDTASGEFKCVFTKNTNLTLTHGQDTRITGPTMQRQWLECFADDYTNNSQ